jgi:acetyltransferase-like isoleucine patch superfamily enzyme
VLVGGSVFLITESGLGSHRETRPQVLRRGCVIGTNVSIMAGLEIGEQAVVGSGTVVVEDVPPRTLVVGAPGRVVRELGPDELRSSPPLSPGG